MKINKTVLLFLVIVTSILLIIFYVGKLTDEELSQNKRTKPPDSINFIVTKMGFTIYDTNGQQKAYLATSKVKHVSAANITKLYSPKLYVKQQNAEWEITAVNGEIIHNKKKIKQIDEIILNNNVVIDRLDNNNQHLAKFNLTSETLTYTPENDTVSTDQFVTIRTPDSITTATGMILQNHTQKLELLSNVESTYSNATNTYWKNYVSPKSKQKD